MADIFVGDTQIQVPTHAGKVVEMNLTRAEVATKASLAESKGGRLFIQTDDDMLVVTRYRTATGGYNRRPAMIEAESTTDTPDEHDTVIQGELQRGLSFP